tara:strand:+ start:669 stop:863 length:195 start_codon:yes stop_codon:yes gene_type:complete
MKRWSNKELKDIESTKIDGFLKDIILVCKKHKMAISHEDHHGGFEVVTLENGDIDWLLAASDDT